MFTSVNTCYSSLWKISPSLTLASGPVTAKLLGHSWSIGAGEVWWFGAAWAVRGV